MSDQDELLDEPDDRPFAVMSEFLARELCKLHGVEFKPIDGQILVVGVLVHIL